MEHLCFSEVLNARVQWSSKYFFYWQIIHVLSNMTYTRTLKLIHTTVSALSLNWYISSAIETVQYSNLKKLAWTHLRNLRIIKRCVHYANKKTNRFTTAYGMVKCGANTRHRKKIPIFRNDTVYVCIWCNFIHLQLLKSVETKTEVRGPL